MSVKSGKPTEDGGTAHFTIDGKTEGDISIPSITRLLDRKKLGLQKPTQKEKQSHKPASTPRPDALSTRSTAPIELHTQIQPKVRRGASTPSPLTIWDRSTLTHSHDPMAQALLALLEKGATSALFLSLAPSQTQSQPTLKSSATLNPGNKKDLWTGLNWNSSITPEVWTGIQQVGYVELSPPGTQTVQTSARNVLRSAFGVGSDEWIYLVRVGPIQSCRGIVAIVSKKTILLDLKSQLSLLNTPLKA